MCVCVYRNIVFGPSNCFLLSFSSLYSFFSAFFFFFVFFCVWRWFSHFKLLQFINFSVSFTFFWSLGNSFANIEPFSISLPLPPKMFSLFFLSIFPSLYLLGSPLICTLKTTARIWRHLLCNMRSCCTIPLAPISACLIIIPYHHSCLIPDTF